MDTKRSTSECHNTEVNEGSFPVSSEVLSNLVRIPHFRIANYIYSDLKCLFQNANCTKSFPE